MRIRESWELLGHVLWPGTPYTRMVDSWRGRREVTTVRVACLRCGEVWRGAGFVLSRCAGAMA